MLTKKDFENKPQAYYDDVVDTCPILSKRVKYVNKTYSWAVSRMVARDFGKMIMAGKDPYNEKSRFEPAN